MFRFAKRKILAAIQAELAAHAEAIAAVKHAPHQELERLATAVIQRLGGRASRRAFAKVEALCAQTSR